MAINVFEGGRRIAKIIAGIWAIGWVCAFFGYAYWVYKHECSILTTQDQDLVGDSFLLCGDKNQGYQGFISYFLGDVDGAAYLIVIGFLLFIWGFTWATGFIVRGFMGIPRGQDKK